MNNMKKIVKFVILGLTAGGLSLLSSCSCGPEPVDPPVYVTPDPK